MWALGTGWMMNLLKRSNLALSKVTVESCCHCAELLSAMTLAVQPFHALYTILFSSSAMKTAKLHFIYLPGARSLLKVRLSQKMKALHHLALPALYPIWLWSKQWTFNTLDILSYKKLTWIGVQPVCHGAIRAMTGTIANPSKRMLIGSIDHSLSELKLLDCSSHSLCWSLRQEGMEWNMDVRKRQLA